MNVQDRSGAQPIVLDWEEALSLAELARACRVDANWVVQLVEVGVLAERSGEPSTWRFRGADLVRARDAQRLQHDFDANLEVVALMLDLMDEVRRLRGRLHSLGVEGS